MTRYKQYLRDKGFRLECDFPCMPFEHTETIETFIYGGTIRVRVYDVRVGWYGYVIFRDGEILGVDPQI